MDSDDLIWFFWTFTLSLYNLKARKNEYDKVNVWYLGGKPVNEIYVHEKSFDDTVGTKESFNNTHILQDVMKPWV